MKTSESIYYDKDGSLGLKVVRVDSESGKKIYQNYWDGYKWLPGGVKRELQPYLREHWKNADEVWFVEGEKCADDLKNRGLFSSTTPGGCKSWKESYAKYFEGIQKVICLPDNDAPGREYITKVISDIQKYVPEIKLLELPHENEGDDIHDYFEKGGNVDKLKLIEQKTTLVNEENAKNDENDFEDSVPLPLYRTPTESIEFPTFLLGEKLERAIQSICSSTLAPTSIAVQSMLSVVSLATQAFCNIEIDGRKIPLSTFHITIALSGERKSGVDKILLKPVYDYQRQLYELFKTELKRYDADVYAFNECKKKINKKGKSRSVLQEEILELGDPPEQPLSPDLILSEPTYEALVKNFKLGQPSVGLFSDEGGRFIGGHALTSDNALKTSAGLSEIFDGKPISRSRAGEATETYYGKRLAMHLMIQPVVADNILGNEILIGQGILNRCLFSWPQSNIGSRPYQEFSSEKCPHVFEVRKRIEELLHEKKNLAEESKNELEPLDLNLSSQAKKIWMEFHDDIEENLLPTGNYGAIKSYGAKIPDQALRIAGLLTKFYDRDHIDDDLMFNATQIARYYIDEFLRISKGAWFSPEILPAKELLVWLRRKNKNLFYLAEIYQKGPSMIRTRATAISSISILETHGWLQKAIDRPVMEGSRRSDVWKVHSSVFEGENLASLAGLAEEASK